MDPALAVLEVPGSDRIEHRRVVQTLLVTAGDYAAIAHRNRLLDRKGILVNQLDYLYRVLERLTHEEFPGFETEQVYYIDLVRIHQHRISSQIADLEQRILDLNTCFTGPRNVIAVRDEYGPIESVVQRDPGYRDWAYQIFIG